ncbi:MAG: hypothetical protein JJT94_10800 [Bernardetiaceae bacterium]|nr:hypothetical protein [Bernardetiaceae bacterium]
MNFYIAFYTFVLTYLVILLIILFTSKLLFIMKQFILSFAFAAIFLVAGLGTANAATESKEVKADTEEAAKTQNGDDEGDPIIIIIHPGGGVTILFPDPTCYDENGNVIDC